MSLAKQRILASLLPVSGFMLCFGMAAQAQMPQTLPVDQPQQVNGIQAACTGVGDREENEARWGSYPVKLEMVGGYGQWLGNEDITIHGQGQDVSVNCAGPWVLMGLEPGYYHATINVPDASPKHISFSVPRHGQRDVIVRFRDLNTGREQPNPS